MLGKIAVVGLGTMGTSFARYALPLCNILLAYDSKQEQMDTLISRMMNDHNPYDQHPEQVDIHANQYKIHLMNSLEMLLAHQPDLVIICTHKETHCDIALAALNSGAHVLVEKPIACNLLEAKKMVAAAERCKRFLFVEFCLHKYPEFEYLSKLIKDKNVSQPVSYTITRIAEVKDIHSINITADFDLQVHDVDYCLQTFGLPSQIDKEATDDRVSKMRWLYKSGLQIDLLGKLPEQHTTPFEYEFTCKFADGCSFSYSNLKNTHARQLEKVSNESIKETIILDNYSAYQRILQEVVTVISNNRYEDVITHPLLAGHAIAALEIIEQSTCNH